MKKEELLLAMKKVIELDDENIYYIYTVNKNNGWEGCASFLTNGEDKIKVYEGKSDSSDDQIYTYKDFIQKYLFELRKEVN